MPSTAPWSSDEIPIEEKSLSETTVIVVGSICVTWLDPTMIIGLATTLWDHPHVMLLGTAIVIACLVCNRIYRGLAHRYKGLETHYEFVSSVVRSTDLSEITTSVLAAARKLLRANDAVVVTQPLRDRGDRHRHL